jgi:16S rRNA (cytosine1402-N4)-methyltransferase
MLSLRIPTRRLRSRWCNSNHHQPCYINNVLVPVREPRVMRLIRTTSSAAIVCLFPTVVIPYTTNRPTTASRYSTAYPFSFTNSFCLPFNQRVRYYATRDRTDEKDDVPIAENVDDEDTDDLYLLSSASASSFETTKQQIQFATSFHAPVMWKECIDAMISCTRGKERQQEQQDIQNDSESIVAINNESSDDLLQQQSTTLTTRTSSLIFVDGTLGGGGHSQALLESLVPGDIVFGADVDPDALRTASQRLQQYIPNNQISSNDNTKADHKPWFIPVPSNFADLTATRLYDALMTACNDIDDISPIQKTVLENIQNDNNGNIHVDGILLDLGVSSYQIDTAERGFAFMKDGPLDMRMDRPSTNNNYSMMDGGGISRTRMTAADACNELDMSELRYIFKTYGDEPRARVIAESIVRRRPLITTNDLYEAVAAVTPQFVRKGRRMGRMATLARIFQSLRIIVNQEDVVLEKALTKMAPSLLRPGGRLVVLSYHSMEDRATKRVMRDGTTSKREADYNNAQKDMYGNYIGEPKPFRTIGKAQKATIEEVEVNPRARSATLRVAERL